jgi:hypothetical protein
VPVARATLITAEALGATQKIATNNIMPKNIFVFICFPLNIKLSNYTTMNNLKQKKSAKAPFEIRGHAHGLYN